MSVNEHPIAANPPPKRIVVLISGRSSNLQALIDAQNGGLFNGKIVGVLSNNPDAAGLQKASKAAIPAAVVNHKEFPERLKFDQTAIEIIDAWTPDLIILAGFMRILTSHFVTHYTGRLINIHPSLLPRHKGLHTHQRALEEKDTQHGCSVHYVTPELDSGQVIAQTKININSDDTPDGLAARILPLEHKLYPLSVKWICEGRLNFNSANELEFDGEKLPASGRLVTF